VQQRARGRHGVWLAPRWRSSGARYSCAARWTRAGGQCDAWCWMQERNGGSGLQRVCEHRSLVGAWGVPRLVSGVCLYTWCLSTCPPVCRPPAWRACSGCCRRVLQSGRTQARGSPERGKGGCRSVSMEACAGAVFPELNTFPTLPPTLLLASAHARLTPAVAGQINTHRSRPGVAPLCMRGGTVVHRMAV